MNYSSKRVCSIFDLSEYALKYGKILTDDEFNTVDGIFIRIRTIDYDGKIYYHCMHNGEVISFISLTDEMYE